MRILGILILGTLFLGAIALSPGAFFEAFIDYPSLIIVFGGTLALLLMSHDSSSWKLGLDFLLGQSDSLTDEDRRALADFYATGSRSALACGLVGQLIGLIIMLGNMDDPQAIGPGLAVSMLTILYGIALSEFVFQPLQKTAQQKLAIGARMPSSRIGLYLVFIVELLVLSKFFMLCLSFVPPDPVYEQMVETMRSRFG